MPYVVFDRCRRITLHGWLLVAAVVVAAVPVSIGWPAPVVGAAIVVAPLLLWLLWAPASQAATVVGLCLFSWYVLSWAMLVAAQSMLTSFAGLDVLALHGPVALAVVLAGIGFLAAARRRMAVAGQYASTGQVAVPSAAAGPSGRRWRILVTAVLFVPCCLSALTQPSAFLSGSFGTVGEPTSADVPLPAGARIVSTNSECGSTGVFCMAEFRVESDSESHSDLASHVAAHWTRLGWSASTPCRFQGLIHRIERCWFVTAINAHTVRVVQHAVPRQGQTTPATIPG